MTLCMSTSLKVVNMAAFCCACNSRSATLARKRVIGTRCSGLYLEETTEPLVESKSGSLANDNSTFLTIG